MPHSQPEPDERHGKARALRLAVPNELAAIESTRSQVLAFLGDHALPTRTIYHLELVLEETLMNRLMHAFPEGGRHCTDLSVQFLSDELSREEPGDLVLCFEDDGIPFDPLQASPPPRPASTVDAAPGGFGLMLTRKAASACHYERIGGRNRFTVRLASH